MPSETAGTEPLNSVGEALSRVPLIEEMLLAAASPANPQMADDPEPEAQAEGEETPENAETVLSQSQTEPPDDAPADPDPAEEEPKPKPEESDEDKELPEAVRKRIEKRIGKEVGKRKALESQLTELRAEVEELRKSKGESANSELRTPNSKPPAADHDPVNDLPEVRAVRAEEQKFVQIADGARNLLKEARRNPDAVIEKLTKSGLQVPPDPDDLRDWLEEQRDNAAQQAQRQATKREVLMERAHGNLMQAMQVQDAEALKVYPWHSDKEDPRHQAAKAIAQANPWILKRPDRLKILGRLVEGEQAEQAKLKPAAKVAPPKPKAPPPKLPGAPSYSPDTPTHETASRQAVLLRAEKEPHNKEARVAALTSLLAEA